CGCLYPAGLLADRRGRRVLLLPAIAWFAFAVAAVGWAGSPIAFGALLALVGIGSGSVAVAPAAMLSDIVPEHVSATAVGVFRFFGDLGVVFGALAAGGNAECPGFQGALPLVGPPRPVPRPPLPRA